MGSEDPGVLSDPVATRGSYQILYGPSLTALVDMGLTDDVDPSKSKLKFKPITTGTTGKDNKLGDRFVGAEVMISVEFRQVTSARLAALCPWSNGSNISLTPPLNCDMYQFSQPLVLHPTERGADTTLDQVYLHAVPVTVPTMKRDGGDDDKLKIDFAVYPDRPGMNSATGTLSLGQGYYKNA